MRPTCVQDQIAHSLVEEVPPSEDLSSDHSSEDEADFSSGVAARVSAGKATDLEVSVSAEGEGNASGRERVGRRGEGVVEGRG